MICRIVPATGQPAQGNISFTGFVTFACYLRIPVTGPRTPCATGFMQQYLPWLIATATLFVLTVLVAYGLLRQSRRPVAGPLPLPVEWDLVPRPVFTADERRVYRLLREALPHHVVLAKLPLVRFCQPSDPQRMRYWYELLGAIHVSFAICSANGRVLAAIDLSYDQGGPPGRATRIKKSVLGACRVRYLRCQADHLPSIPELQLLVPQSSSASRGPQPAQVAGGAPGNATGNRAATSRRRERTTLWQDSTAFSDSFFAPERFHEPSSVDGPHSRFGDSQIPERARFDPPDIVDDDAPPPTRPARH